MGTNYYAVKTKPTLHGIIHLGKSSAGWKFLFKENEEEEIRTYPQFIMWLERYVDTGEYVILNEYDEQVSKSDLLQLIQDKQKQPNNVSDEENFRYCKNIDGYRFSESDFC